MSVESTPIAQTVIDAALAGQRLGAAEVEALAASTDLLALGALADDVRRRRHAVVTSFVRVHVLEGERADLWMAAPERAGEVRIVSRPPTPEAAIALVQRARLLAGDRVLRGFALADLVTLGGAPVFAALRAEGLDEVALVEPGDGAGEAVAAARAAGLGVRTAGLGAPVADRTGWLRQVRALADATGGIDAVAPLPRLADPTTATTGFDDVRLVALARLVLDNVPHVQVDWRLHGPKLAQVALTVGADDVDGVAADDDTSRGSRRAPLEEIRRNIIAAGLTPVERDGRFVLLA